MQLTRTYDSSTCKELNPNDSHIKAYRGLRGSEYSKGVPRRWHNRDLGSLVGPFMDLVLGCCLVLVLH